MKENELTGMFEERYQFHLKNVKKNNNKKNDKAN